MRRILWAILAMVLGVAMIGWIFRGTIALRVMSRALESRLAADPIGALPDGLHVTLCGAGGPLPDPVRSAACVAIVAGRSLYLVDAGSGAARNLIGVGFQPLLVESVFLTHFHSDHIDGLGELGLLRWTAGSHRLPLSLYGAEGVSHIQELVAQPERLLGQVEDIKRALEIILQHEPEMEPEPVEAKPIPEETGEMTKPDAETRSTV